ncbi:MAG: Maf family nucleotide pyrophosphatase [Muribaculaceae bacterium]
MNPLQNLEKYRVILASNSPRRRELLAGLGISFEVKTLSGVDESYPADIATEDISLYISQKKADAYKQLIVDNELVITSDTIVVLDDEVYGKPADAADACRMLQQLSGRTHRVITGVTITTKHRCSAFKVTSEVEFAALSNDEIAHYVESCRPLDKAGAYGIQEWIGMAGVKGISGSFYNVMGLPVQRLYTELKSY